MSGNDTTIKFKADIASLKKEFREASNIIRLANSEFKASSAQLDNWENEADGVSAKLTQLNTVLSAQKSQLKVLKEQYEKTVAQQGEASSGAQALLIKMNNQKAAVGNTEKQIRKYNGRLSELKSSTDEAEKSSGDFDTEVKNLDDSLEETAEEAVSLSEGFTVMKGVLADLAATAIKNVVQGFKDIGAAVKDAYLEYDEGIDNVIKATGATGEAADNLKESYKEVSKSVVADYGSIGDTLGKDARVEFKQTLEDIAACPDIASATTQAIEIFGKKAGPDLADAMIKAEKITIQQWKIVL